MIRDEVELRVTLEQLSRMYETLAALQNDRERYSDEWFGLMSEGPLEEIRRMEADLSDYKARVAAAAEGALQLRAEERRRALRTQAAAETEQQLHFSRKAA
jgi:hypothetical protein